VFAGEIFLALHFDEAAPGALELKCDAVAPVEFDGWGSGGDDEVDVPVVQFVDQGDETASFVFVE
jgi:hypothetical protein